MIVHVERDGRYDAEDALTGQLRAGDLVLATLERSSLRVPPGVYPLALTVSGRAQAGTLWSPRGDKRLWLIDKVPGRSGIRIHAANWARQLEGCVAVGTRAGSALEASRDALARLMNLLGEDEHQIEIR